jgi:hypothetical protein
MRVKLGNNQFEKVFTREEANELLPRLELILGGLQTQARLLREKLGELSSGDRADRFSEAGLEQIISERPELRALTEQMASSAKQIEELGCFLKDIELGLVDFPCDVGGEIVFLCWQSGEPQISAWHTIDSGFANRRPLAGISKSYLN